MRGFSYKRILAVLITALVVSLWVQTGAAVAQTAKKLVVQVAAPVKAEKKTDVDQVRPAPLLPKSGNSLSKEEKQSIVNELRRELLDNRAEYIDRWLGVVAIVLTFFGIVVAILGIIGFRRFQGIEKEARENVGVANKHVEEAKGLVEEIKGYRDESKAIRDETAESAANEPERVKQVAEDVSDDPQSPLIDKAIADAISLQQEQKLEEAIEKWRGIANVVQGIDDGLSARAWFSAGYLFGKLRKHEEAIGAFDEAIRLRPDGSANAYINRGVAKGKLGLCEASIADFNEAILLKPDFAEAYFSRGLTKGKSGQHEAAIADFDEAILLKPNFAEAFLNRGVAKAALGRYEFAITDYDEAIQLNPNLGKAYNGRGSAKIKLGQHEAAILDYDEAIRLDPSYPLCYGNRGLAYLEINNKEAARRDFEKALELARNAGDDKIAKQAEEELKKLDEE